MNFKVIEKIDVENPNLVLNSVDFDVERLLKVCEISGPRLRKRIRSESLSIQDGDVLYKICKIFYLKWNFERDYRYLNIIFKFQSFGFINYFSDIQKSSLGLTELAYNLDNFVMK